MRCGRIKRMLSVYVDNELTRDKRAIVENHTSHCPACRQELSDFKKGHKLLSRKDTQAAGALFWESLISKLEDKQEELTNFYIRLWIRRLIPVTSALALTAGVLLVKNIVEKPRPVVVDSIIAENGVSMEERIVDSGEKITNDTVLRLVAYYPSGW